MMTVTFATFWGWTLKAAGYRHVACTSGACALESISPQHAGCVLIDLHLPDMIGTRAASTAVGQALPAPVHRLDR